MLSYRADSLIMETRNQEEPILSEEVLHEPISSDSPLPAVQINSVEQDGMHQVDVRCFLY